MQEFATKPLTVRQVWSEGYALARERWYPLYFLFIVNQLLILLTTYLFTGPNKSLVDSFREHPLNVMLYFIVVALIILFIYAVAFQQLGSNLQTRDLELKDSIQIIKRKFLTLIVASILSFLATIAGLVVFVIPGIYIMVALFFYFPALILDEMRPVAALQYTFKLVWRQWWRSLYVIIGIGFITGTISALFTLVIVMFSFFIPVLSTPLNFLNNIFTVLFQSFVSIMLIAIQLIQWNDLKIRKQLLDSNMMP